MIFESLNAIPVMYPAISSIVYAVLRRFSLFMIKPPTSATSLVIFRRRLSTSSSMVEISARVFLTPALSFFITIFGNVANSLAAFRILLISSCKTATAFLLAWTSSSPLYISEIFSFVTLIKSLYKMRIHKIKFAWYLGLLFSALYREQ